MPRVVLDPAVHGPFWAGLKKAGIDIKALQRDADDSYKRAKKAIKGTHSSFHKADVRLATFIATLDKYIKQ